MTKRLPKMESQSELTRLANAYVEKKMFEVGGVREAVCGFWHKTGPQILRLNSLTFGRSVLLLLRVGVVCLAASLPILARKLSNCIALANGDQSLSSLLEKLDGTDYGLASVAIACVVVPKGLDMFSKVTRLNGDTILPTHELASSIKRIPVPGTGGSVDDALKHALQGLRNELSELIGDERGRRLTDVTLLEFCDKKGLKMQVRARTADEEVKKPKASWKFLAYYVCMRGRWFAEQDFYNPQNPFPKTRLTVTGDLPVNYRSVLYIPLIVTRHGGDEKKVVEHPTVVEDDDVDYCNGVICVHSSKPYRFWRWGDHKKGVDGFGNVAVSRAAPYIALVAKLIHSTAHQVPIRSS